MEQVTVPDYLSSIYAMSWLYLSAEIDMTVAVSGQRVVNSTDCRTFCGTSDRGTDAKPSLAKNASAVSVSKKTVLT